MYHVWENLGSWWLKYCCGFVGMRWLSQAGRRWGWDFRCVAREMLCWISRRCWGDWESFDFAMEHLSVQILWDKVRLAVTMLDEKLDRVMALCSWWQAVAATVQRGVILPRRKEVKLIDDLAWKAR